MIFSLALGLAGGTDADLSVPVMVALTLAYIVVMLAAARRALPPFFRWLEERAAEGTVVAWVLALALLDGSFTQWVGIHSIFGAFMVGVALSESALSERTRESLTTFAAGFFSPLFFSSVGLSMDFGEHFRPLVVLVVLVTACAGKSISGTFPGDRAPGNKHAGQRRRP